jgi:hypothetical protein
MNYKGMLMAHQISLVEDFTRRLRTIRQQSEAEEEFLNVLGVNKQEMSTY